MLMVTIYLRDESYDEGKCCASNAWTDLH